MYIESTEVGRDMRGSWSAKTWLAIDDMPNHKLCVHTMKRSSGYTTTNAAVWETQTERHAFLTARDYNVGVITDDTRRCTEANVRAQHARAVARVVAGEYSEAIARHYAKAA